MMTDVSPVYKILLNLQDVTTNCLYVLGLGISILQNPSVKF